MAEKPTSPHLFADVLVAKGKGVEVKRSQLDEMVINVKSSAVAGGQTVPPDRMPVAPRGPISADRQNCLWPDYLSQQRASPLILGVLLFILVSPMLGFLLGSLMMVLVSHLFRRSTPSRVDRWFRRLQLVSAGAYSLGHGGNDAQKTIGIIWMLLIATGQLSTDAKQPPIWVELSCYTAIALGTMFGGWRIVKTMGQKITKLRPVGGFCAETGGAITLFLASALGIPVSTTHTITGAIVGVGSTQRASAVRWGVAGNIVWAWIFTIPASAFVAAVAYWISLQIF